MSFRLTRRAVALAGAGLVAGCGARAGERANILRIGIGLEPPNLDPTAGAAAAIDEIVYANVFEGLTRIGPDGAVRPALASHWETDRSGRSYLFHLREGVRFHDGAQFTADDVVFTLNRARAPDSANAQKELFAPIQEIAALDPLRVRIDLARPASGFLFNLGWGDAVMVSPPSAETNATNPIGTGPFRFDRWAKGAFVSLQRNTAYWGAPAALDGARFTIVPDASAAFASLLAGDIDGFPDFPAPELLPQIARDSRFRIAVGASEGETILAINNQKAPFDDVRVRRAMAHAVDRRAVIDGAMFGYGAPIGSHFTPQHPAYVDLADLYPYDPPRARALLAEAGVSNLRPTLKLPPTTYARRGGEIIAAQLRAVGVEPRIENIEWAQWLEQVFANKNFDLTIVAHTEPLDIGIYARDDYYFGYRSDAFKSIMSDVDSARNEAALFAALAAAQRRIAEDCVNVFLFAFPKIGVWRSEIEGVWRDAPVQANDLTAAHWAAP